ncbi:hypothetical protein [Pseudoteredinibacter isoporae]|uniref:hypothetical protein n=1 Tax=Pseudoteredinibacter isoporae TaxID=570281 RepID=UPI003107936D
MDTPTDSLELELQEIKNEDSALEVAPPQSEIVAGEQQQAQELSAKSEYFGLIKTVLTPMPGILCPAWGIQEAEIEALADAYATACAETWPGGVGETGPWVGALITTLAVVGPRVRLPRRLKETQGEEGGADDGAAD